LYVYSIPRGNSKQRVDQCNVRGYEFVRVDRREQDSPLRGLPVHFSSALASHQPTVCLAFTRALLGVPALASHSVASDLSSLSSPGFCAQKRAQVPTTTDSTSEAFQLNRAQLPSTIFPLLRHKHAIHQQQVKGIACISARTNQVRRQQRFSQQRPVKHPPRSVTATRDNS
jgi:hypothetical protein